MLQLENLTPFAAATTVYANAQGVDTLQIVVKGSFDIGPSLHLCEAQPEPVVADEYWGEPELTSLKAASDFLPPKTCTDILLAGDAVAPDEREITHCDVGIRVGSLSHCFRVTGDRQWRSGTIGPALPFTRIPLLYENAYGGQASAEVSRQAGYEYNPVGKGFFTGKAVPDNTSLPNIERIDMLIDAPSDKPLPAGCGPIAPGWQPRAKLAGTYDAKWQTDRAPFLPLDYNPAFANTAPEGLLYPGFLEGGEPIELVGVHRSGPLSAVVPSVKMSCSIGLGGQTVSVPFQLETLLLEPNTLKVSLVWKAVYACVRCQEKVNTVSIKLVR